MDGGQRAGVPGVQGCKRSKASPPRISRERCGPGGGGGQPSGDHGCDCWKAVLFAASLESNEVFLREVNLGSVLDHKHPLVRGNEFSEDR